jgi:hypothetical protein
MANVCLIRPVGAPPGDLQNTFSGWADHTKKKITSPTHTLQKDYQYSSPTPPTSLTADVAASNIIIFYGHGSWSKLLVRDASGTDHVWFESKATAPTLGPAAFKGKTLVALACETGDTFGPDAQTAGASGFLGFDEALVVIDTATVPSTHFQDAIVSGADEILNGKSTTDAARRMKDLFKDTHDFFKTGGGRTDPNAVFARIYASWAAAASSRFSLLVLFAIRRAAEFPPLFSVSRWPRDYLTAVATAHGLDPVHFQRSPCARFGRRKDVP